MNGRTKADAIEQSLFLARRQDKQSLRK